MLFRTQTNEKEKQQAALINADVQEDGRRWLVGHYRRMDRLAAAGINHSESSVNQTLMMSLMHCAALH